MDGLNVCQVTLIFGMDVFWYHKDRRCLKAQSESEECLPKFSNMIPKYPWGREGCGCSLAVLVRLVTFENIWCICAPISGFCVALSRFMGYNETKYAKMF